MAFGIKKEDQKRSPVEDSVIGDYPGFTPPRYFRPTTPVIEREDDPSQVPNNTDRGTESHGLYIDSRVHPKDAVTEDHDEDSSEVAEIYPEFEDDCPVPVRIVDDQGRHRNEIIIEAFTVGDAPVRILGQDSNRVRAILSSVAGGANLLTDANNLVANGFPVPVVAASGVLTLTTDQELWAAASTPGSPATINVLIERRVITDLPDSATRK